MDNLILLILGLFISVLGITNIKGNISTIHSYNRRKVQEEDIPKYGKVVGTGTLIMGVSFILGYIALFWSETAMAVIILPGVVVGLGVVNKKEEEKGKKASLTHTEFGFLQRTQKEGKRGVKKKKWSRWFFMPFCNINANAQGEEQ